jgi:antitoxin PrlF
MTNEDTDKYCCTSTNDGIGCCKIESVVSIDERGQMVLPKETRDKASIHAGDKLALISWQKNEKICCMFLIKAEELAEMAKNVLSPIMKDILK